MKALEKGHKEVIPYVTLVPGVSQAPPHLTLTTTLSIGVTVIPISLTDEKTEAERGKNNLWSPCC